MSNFTVHTADTAPENSRELLAGAQQAFGFIPNLIGTFAESPAALEAYLALGQIFDKSSFSATERQTVILAVSRYNECHYCVAAHSVVAGMQKVPAEVIEAIRNDSPIADSRLEALRNFTTAVVDKRGWVSAEEVDAFIDAGFTQAQVVEVVLGVTFKTLSNYTNHIADTPLDDAFAGAAWAPVEAREAS